MYFYIEDLKIELINKDSWILLKMGDYQLPLPGQTIEGTLDIITNNFNILKSKYAKHALQTIENNEINEVCLKVALHFFGIYNLWKFYIERENDRDLSFISKDFNHPQAKDIIIQYFRNKYPLDFLSKSASLLDMEVDKLAKYIANRDEFYNAFR